MCGGGYAEGLVWSGVCAGGGDAEGLGGEALFDVWVGGGDIGAGGDEYIMCGRAVEILGLWDVYVVLAGSVGNYLIMFITLGLSQTGQQMYRA